MRRRDFITLLGGAAAAWPLAASAQQTATPLIGFLSSRAPGESAGDIAGFRQGLEQTGYIEGGNVHIAFRWAEGQFARLPSLAAELVQARVAVIAAVGGAPSGLAAKAATATIPIVTVASEPDKVGLVASLNRPGGNVTGVSPLSYELDAKRLELLHELVPTTATIAVLVNPNSPVAERQSKDIEAAARVLGLQIRILYAGTEREIDAAFASVVEHRAGALFVSTDAFFNMRGDRLVELAAERAIPTMYSYRASTVSGGLISYSASLAEAYRQAGIYTGRILKGEKPPDLPVMQPTKFDLVINRKTAKSLGLNIPATLLALADEVIE
jgi:putative ABC transport system substrate-binding protein